MIEYYSIDKNNMFGTMMYCIQNFPEDFNIIENLSYAINMGNHDIQIIYALDKNPNVNKTVFYNSTINQPCITHRLLRENFFDPYVYITDISLTNAFKFYVNFGAKFPKRRNHYLKMFIRKILKPRINININTIEQYYFELPKELQEYFFKTLFYSDSTESSLVIISKFCKDYNSLTYFFRHCKPELHWDKLIHSISEDTFYRIISITNRMKCYKNILHSYEEIKQLYPAQIIPNVYSKFITDYLKAYTDNSMMSQFLKEKNPMSIDFHSDCYRVHRTNPFTTFSVRA